MADQAPALGASKSWRGPDWLPGANPTRWPFQRCGVLSVIWAASAARQSPARLGTHPCHRRPGCYQHPLPATRGLAVTACKGQPPPRPRRTSIPSLDIRPKHSPPCYYYHPALPPTAAPETSRSARVHPRRWQHPPRLALYHLPRPPRLLRLHTPPHRHHLTLIVRPRLPARPPDRSLFASASSFSRIQRRAAYRNAPHPAFLRRQQPAPDRTHSCQDNFDFASKVTTETEKKTPP